MTLSRGPKPGWVWGLLLFAFAGAAAATDRWSFAERIAVSPPAAAGVFHHLEGAGRRHIAVSRGTVAIVWEDDHSGDPQVYVALKTDTDSKFSAPIKISTGREAYEPAIAALEDRIFVIAWEQDGTVVSRTVRNGEPGPLMTLGGNNAGQVSLDSHRDLAVAVWRERREGKWNLFTRNMNLNGQHGVNLGPAKRVESEDSDTPVLYPAIAVNQLGITVAWEDRRAGHTRIKQSFAGHGESFTSPQYLNEFFSNRNQYDKGSGATRVALDDYGSEEVLAAWMDKRRGNTGYGIFAAFGSEDAFGPNEKVHGEPGDKLPHYNPSVAGNLAGDWVIAWDDYRSQTSDIWLSSYTDDLDWSADYAPPPASGPGEQSHVSATLDEDGMLHLVWIERSDVDAPTRLWYSMGSKR